jgi:RNA polymerase sigma-70 factor (ECF subfamily)
LDRLMPIVYEELRGIARCHLSLERHPRTLLSTALVDEAYVRLIGQNRVQWRDRAHFFALSARHIRRILRDPARRRHAKKRGVAAQRLTREDVASPTNRDARALDQACRSSIPPRRKVVELRFFAGLTIAETAEALKIAATVERDWITARTWRFDQFNKIDHSRRRPNDSPNAGARLAKCSTRPPRKTRRRAGNSWAKTARDLEVREQVARLLAALDNSRSFSRTPRGGAGRSARSQNRTLSAPGTRRPERNKKGVSRRPRGRLPPAGTSRRGLVKPDGLLA